jgi:hypothetical protein
MPETKLPKNKRIAKKALSVNLSYKKVFGTEEGQEVLKDLVVSCGLMQDPSDFSHSSLAFKAGAESIVKRILQALHTPPETYIKLIETIRDEQEDIYED